MPRKITLTVEDAEAEMSMLSELILSCKDMVTRNRHTARRSRLARHVTLHSNMNKTIKQSLVIVHLRSQVHILRAMLLQMVINVPNLDEATGVHATGVGDLGLQQGWLDEMAIGPIMQVRLTYDTVVSPTNHVSTESSVGRGGSEDTDIDFLDELEGAPDGGGGANDIETVMREDPEWNGCGSVGDIFGGSL
ncbi:hypothetical protein T484DRAFT_1756887 [Baffinella frigidus]|nr:hypothetical protein T484DRAFT_1756887 [Cryptophyta sp. CCMP2293]